MIAKLRYLGRALAIIPGEIGQALESICTVGRTAVEMDWEARKTVTVSDPVPLFWYDQDEQARKVFCTLSGYGPAIEAFLRGKKYRLLVEDLVDDGLGQPDLSRLRGVFWRAGQKAVFAKLLAHKRGIIDCPTGYGKTYLAKLLAQVYPKARIVVTVNSNDIAGDIYHALKFELRDDLGRVGGGQNKPARVTVATSQSLHKVRKDVNLILADECHTLMTESYTRIFNRFHRARIFGFTATPDGRSDNGEGFGHAVFGPVIARVSYQQGVEGGNVVQLRVRVYASAAGPDVSQIMIKARADRKGLWLNQKRNDLIARVVRQTEEEIGPDQQMLIMVDKTEHAYALGQLLPEFAIVTGEPTAARLVEMRTNHAMSEGQEPCTKKMRDEYRRQFEAHELKRAIATKIWSKGVDFRDLAVLVRADGTGSPIDSGQVPGRLSRLGQVTVKESGLLIDFLDTFSPNLQHRSQQRLRVYRKLGFEVEMR